MKTPDSITEQLQDQPLIILDGAMGTELERLGVPMDQLAWSAIALETHPDLVREVHQNYIRAGANVITTNTYATPPHYLQRAGLENRIDEWNRIAVAMALEERDRVEPEQPVFIAGSVSTFGHNFGDGPMSETDMRSSFRRQGEILADAGVDLLLLETLAAPLEVVNLILEESTATNLPIWLGLSCLRQRDSGQILHGIQESSEHSNHKIEYTPFADVVKALASEEIDALLMMHSELSVTTAATEILSEHFQGTVGVYPNVGYWKRPQWAFVDGLNPDDFVEHGRVWLNMGVQIIGGCCGIGPDHIKGLSKLVS